MFFIQIYYRGKCFYSADPEYKEAAVSTDVFVKADGNVTWLFFAIYQSSCMIRVRFYPFDDQVMKNNFS